jgi:hypothetical protein
VLSLSVCVVAHCPQHLSHISVSVDACVVQGNEAVPISGLHTGFALANHKQGALLHVHSLRVQQSLHRLDLAQRYRTEQLAAV